MAHDLLKRTQDLVRLATNPAAREGEAANAAIAACKAIVKGDLLGRNPVGPSDSGALIEAMSASLTQALTDCAALALENWELLDRLNQAERRAKQRLSSEEELRRTLQDERNRTRTDIRAMDAPEARAAALRIKVFDFVRTWPGRLETANAIVKRLSGTRAHVLTAIRELAAETRSGFPRLVLERGAYVAKQDVECSTA